MKYEVTLRRVFEVEADSLDDAETKAFLEWYQLSISEQLWSEIFDVKVHKID